MPHARRGRRPGQSTTRQAVLDAARRRFAADGFTGTTIRAIAADAGVDAALVMQFFRSKDELFGAVMSISPEVLARIAAAFSGPVESVGERVVRAILAAWEGDHPDAHALGAMLRGAITNDRASEQLRDFIQARLLDGARELAGTGTDATLRAGLAASMLVGVVTGRTIIAVPALVAAGTEELVAVLSPAIQQVLVPQQTARATGNGHT